MPRRRIPEMALAGLSMVMLFVLLSSTTVYQQLHAQLYYGPPVVDVGVDGVVNVSISVWLEEGLNTLPLPVEPIPPTILVFGNGRTMPIVYDNGTLYLLLDKAMNVSISYIANVSILNNIFYLNILTEDVVEVRMPVDVILLSWPEENLVDVGVVQDLLVMRIRGPVTLRYTLRSPHTLPPYTSPAQPQPTQTLSPYTSPAEPQPTPKPEQQIDQQTPFPWLLLVIGVAVGLSVAGYLLLRRSRAKRATDTVVHLLGDVDFEIIRVLEARGGSALQTELQDAIKVPKTTLWRHIKKLEKLGIVKVEKVGLQNRVTLIKRIKY